MWLYEHNEDNSARYILGEQGRNMLACFGINPSTATPEALDPTLSQVKKRAAMYGYDGWVMFNVYPQRSTDPNGLHSEPDMFLHAENMRVIKEFFESTRCDIWAAWGTLVNKRRYLPACVSEIAGYTEMCRWLKIGKLSVQGHPHHPLYLSHKYEPEPFDIEGYLASLHNQEAG